MSDARPSKGPKTARSARLRLAAAALLLAGTTGAARGAKPPPRSQALLERGKATYSIYCVSCHGEQGAGDGSVAPTLNPRPRNFATDKFKQGAGVAQIFETLGKGVPGTAMVKFTNLSEDDRWALSWYVLELRNASSRR